MNNITETVKHLIIINVLFFIGSEFMGKDVQELLSLYYFESTKFRFWQPLSHMFMHSGIMHIAFNMFALFSFGSMLESMWGSKKFLFFYISCGLGAAALHTAVNYFQFHQELNILVENGFSTSEIYSTLAEGKLNSGWQSVLSPIGLTSLTSSYFIPAVGASGAIYGLLVAFAFMFPNAELMMLFIPVPVKAKYFVPGILVIDLVLGLKGNSIFGGNGTGIAHFAHIGGALIGFLMMWFWKKNSFDKNRWN